MRRAFIRVLMATITSVAIVLIFFGPQDLSQAMGPSLQAIDASESEIEGTYTVILFGARYADDIQTIAFLDREGDRYTFEIVAPDFDYKVLKSIPARKALEEAYQFVSWHPDYLRTVLGKILDDKGTAVGFEVRPFYRTTRFPSSDVMDIMYFQRGDTIKVHVKLKPKVERQLSSGGDGGHGGRGK